MLTPWMFTRKAGLQGHAEINATVRSLMADIRKKTVRDKELGDIHGGDEWTDEQGVVLYCGRVYVPKECRALCLKEHHDAPVIGHPGQAKTLEMVRRNYWWPSMRKDVQEYVRSCHQCQQTKVYPTKPSGLLHPMEVPEELWHTVTVDLITGLPLSSRYDSIFVTVNRFSKMIHLCPTNGELNAEGCVCLFLNSVWKLHGLPKKVISD